MVLYLHFPMCLNDVDGQLYIHRFKYCYINCCRTQQLFVAFINNPLLINAIKELCLMAVNIGISECHYTNGMNSVKMCTLS